MKEFYVYIMASKSKALYTGITNDLQRRVYEHKNPPADSFASRYNIDRLVYSELSRDIKEAIIREKQIKGWLRSKKVAFEIFVSLRAGKNTATNPRFFALLRMTSK